MKNLIISGIFLVLCGCATGAPYSDDSLIGTSRPPKMFPQQGYLLDEKGTYTFKPSAMSRP